MRELLEFILQNALPENTEFQIEEGMDDIGIVFTITVAAEARGQLIGKAGKNIKAIRDVLSILARKQGTKVFIKIAD
ncbi:MAG: KH domain-containing protein [Candidatus Doudnabacteria bacterium]|nr:KH domain-containing protein [Candidatus Doudnabacteria bacterium]